MPKEPDVQWPRTQEQQNEALYMVPTPKPWWRRILLRFFPYATRPEIAALHGVGTDVHIRIDWLDRLRVLVSGHVLVVISMDTETEPTRVTAARVSVCVVAPGEPS